ncbi:hypothetical protein [Tenacibaculum sp. M341]|nr:hypothetical protein [Tenacibaculum sp. M341]TCI90614.1 hypothetical protein EYW44_12870 [Tenacibaculum sp. M341]
MNKKKTSVINKIFIAICLIFFIISLTQNTYFVGEEKIDSVGSNGLIALLFGWMFMFDLKVIPWLANPLILISLICILKNRIKRAKIFGLIALLCGLSFLLFDNIIVNEGGTEKPITGYDIGYFLWIMSLSTNFLGIMISDYLNPNNCNENNIV